MMALPPEVRALYPFDGRRVRLASDLELHYVDEGRGAPLLMVHGNPTWSFYYRALILGLRHRQRCIAPDHIGCGLSDKPGHWSYTIADHADNLSRLILKLDLRNITLVTHDWGGPIGLLAATSLPDRFQRLVTFNTAVSLLPLPRMLTALRLPVLGPLVIQGLNGMIRAGFFDSFRTGHRLAPPVRAGYLAPYDSWAARIALLRFVQEIPIEDEHPNRTLLRQLDGRLATIAHLPHLVVWGLKDPVFRSEYLAGWRERFPQAEVHVLDDASHWVVEVAAERILPILVSFLERTDAGAG